MQRNSAFFFSLGPFLPFLEHQEVMSWWSCPKCSWILFITSFRNSATVVEAVATDHCTEFCLLVWKLTLCYFRLAEEALKCLPCVCASPNSLWNERTVEAMRMCSTRSLSSHFCHSAAQSADSSCSFQGQWSHFPFISGVQKASSHSERNHHLFLREKTWAVHSSLEIICVCSGLPQMWGCSEIPCWWIWQSRTPIWTHKTSTSGTLAKSFTLYWWLRLLIEVTNEIHLIVDYPNIVLK